MLRTFVVGIAVAILGCGGGKTGVYKHDYAGSLTLTFVNASPRTIDAIYIHPIGTTDRGGPWTDPILVGNISTVKIRPGGYELIAVSHERTIDEHTGEVPQAMTMLELRADRGNQKLVFYDNSQTVTGLDEPNTIGVTFMVSR